VIAASIFGTVRIRVNIAAATSVSHQYAQQNNKKEEDQSRLDRTDNIEKADGYRLAKPFQDVCVCKQGTITRPESKRNSKAKKNTQ